MNTRTLKFVVDGQILKKDENCDFKNLIPGSANYITLDFTFSSDWDNCVKVVGFYSLLGREYEPQLLKDGHSCFIPQEAADRKSFKIKVFGTSADDTFTINTNKLTITQDGDH